MLTVAMLSFLNLTFSSFEFKSYVGPKKTVKEASFASDLYIFGC